MAGPWMSFSPRWPSSLPVLRAIRRWLSSCSVLPRKGCSVMPISRPLCLLAELTYRCPLQCPYCSNPLELGRYREELATAEWQRVLSEAAALGVVQVHFSGGE